MGGKWQKYLFGLDFLTSEMFPSLQREYRANILTASRFFLSLWRSLKTRKRNNEK